MWTIAVQRGILGWLSLRLSRLCGLLGLCLWLRRGRAALCRGFPNPQTARTFRRSADWEIGDTAGLETCATQLSCVRAEAACEISGLDVNAIFAELMGKVVGMLQRQGWIPACHGSPEMQGHDRLDCWRRPAHRLRDEGAANHGQNFTFIKGRAGSPIREVALVRG